MFFLPDLTFCPANLGIYAHVKKSSDLVIPGPTETWVYLDEHPDSINDAGCFAPNSANSMPDAPSTTHNGAGGFAFADGHAEIHKWLGNTMKTPRARFGLQGVAMRDWENTIVNSARGDRADIQWYSYHTPRRSQRTVVQ